MNLALHGIKESDKCPVCGGELGNNTGLRWIRESRTLIGEGVDGEPHAFVLSPQKAQAFDCLWKAYEKRQWAQRSHIHHEIWGHRRDGGADLKTIDVIICALRQMLRVFGLTIKTQAATHGSYGEDGRFMIWRE